MIKYQVGNDIFLKLELLKAVEIVDSCTRLFT